MGCWVYTGHRVNGYGTAKVRMDAGRRNVRVHRAVYEVLVGPIPEGLDLDHLCRNRACYNPAHLEPVTRPENLRRGGQARGHAPQAHGTRASYTHLPLPVRRMPAGEHPVLPSTASGASENSATLNPRFTLAPVLPHATAKIRN